MNAFQRALTAIFTPSPAFDPHIEIPPVPAHPRPSIRDVIAGVKLPNTAEQSAMIKSLGLKTVEPTIKIGNIKIETPFRAVDLTVNGVPAGLPEPTPQPSPRSTDGAERLVPFSSIRSWCDTKDAELATAHDHIAELENKLRWSLQRETALRDQLHALTPGGQARPLGN